MRVPLIGLAALLPASVFAVFQDEAFVNDWHIPLLGPSLSDSTFFHRPVFDAKASLIYTLSERNILAALHPKDGGVVWRHQLEQCGLKGVSRSADGAIVAGACGEVKVFDAVAGRLVWENEFATGRVRDVQVVKEEGRENAVVVLMDNGSVRMLDGASGNVKWEWKGADSYVYLFYSDGGRFD